MMINGDKMVIVYSGVDSLGRHEQLQVTASTMLGWVWQIANGMVNINVRLNLQCRKMAGYF